MWRKTRKRKSLILSFIEKARFRRTGAIFPRFSDKRSQARSEHEVWVTHARRSTKKERQNQLYPVPTPIVQAIFFPRHRRRLQQTWFYLEATFSPKKWRLQVNIWFYALVWPRAKSLPVRPSHPVDKCILRNFFPLSKLCSLQIYQ